MAWKAERWLSDVFPGPESVYSEYRQLPRRELAIVACSVLDCALAELLSMRLSDNARECEGFLGLNEDGRAPCATFGARIQLGLLLDVITEADCKILRGIKNIRNKLAHRVKADYTSPEVLPLVLALYDNLAEISNQLIERGLLSGPKHGELVNVREFLPTTPEAGAAIVLIALVVYQAYFHRLSEVLIRIQPFKTDRRV